MVNSEPARPLISESPTSVELLNILTGHTGVVFSVAFSPDNKILATTAGDSIRFWDIKSGKLLYKLLGVSLGDMAFSPDSQYFSGVADGYFRIWKLSMDALSKCPDSSECNSTLSLVKENTIQDLVTSIAYSPDASYIVTGSFDKVLRVWSPAGDLMNAIGAPWMVTSVAISPDGKYVADGVAGDGFLIVYRAANWKSIIQKKSEDGSPVQSVAFLSNDKVLAATAGGSVYAYDMSGNLLYSLNDPARDIWKIAVAPDKKVFSVTPLDTVVRIYDSSNGNKLASLSGHTGYVRSIAFSPDGSLLAVGSDDGSVRIWGNWPK